MYRSLDCTTWDDPWFSELGPSAKLLFLFAITNHRQTSCGVFEITARAIAFETSIAPENIPRLFRELEPKVIWWPELNTVFVTNFYKHQSSNTGPDFVKGARKALTHFTPEVQAWVVGVYPDLATVDASQGGPTPHPHPTHTPSVTVTETESVTEGDGGATSAPAPEKRKRKVLTTVPDEWVITDEQREWARTEAPGVDIVQQTKRMLDHFKGNGERKADWEATWRNWMRRVPDFDRRPGNGKYPNPTGEPVRLDPAEANRRFEEARARKIAALAHNSGTRAEG